VSVDRQMATHRFAKRKSDLIGNEEFAFDASVDRSGGDIG
jgi:hypothetical protein